MTHAATPYEFEPQHERYDSHDSYFAGVAVSEAHALTYVLMNLQQGPYSRKDMRNLFMDAQGVPAEWEVASNINFNYAAGRFAQAGLTETFKVERLLDNRRQPVEVLVTDLLADSNHDEALAIAGAVMDWSLSHELSIRKIFGESRGEDGSSGTLNRKNILTIIRNNPSISEIEIAQYLEDDTVNVNAYLSEMQSKNLINIERATDWEKRSITLNGRGFSHVAYKREDIFPETRAIYDAVDIFVASGTTEVNAQALFDLAMKIAPYSDIARLQHTVAQAIKGTYITRDGNSEYITKNIPSVDDGGTFSEGNKKTKCYLNPEIANDLSDLLDTLELLAGGDVDFRQYYVKRAKEIANDFMLVRTLVSKAKASSPQKNIFPDDRMVELIQDSVSTDGAMSVKALVLALRQRGVVMSEKGVDSKVRSLTSAGLISTEQRPKSSKSTLLVKYVLGKTTKLHR